MPLGVLPFPTYEEVSAPLTPGDTLLLYTDGLVERPGEHLDDGLARAGRRRVREAPEDPDALLDHLLDTLVPGGRRDGRRGAPDALRNLPVPEQFSAEFPAEPESLAPIRGMLRRWLSHAGADELEIAEITTACGEAATNAIEHAGTSERRRFEVSGSATARDRARGARPRRLARGARGRPRQGPRPDAHADGYRCGGARGGGNHGQPPAAARGSGGSA